MESDPKEPPESRLLRKEHAAAAKAAGALIKLKGIASIEYLDAASRRSGLQLRSQHWGRRNLKRDAT